MSTRERLGGEVRLQELQYSCVLASSFGFDMELPLKGCCVKMVDAPVW